jgi:ABC-type branched-subunit amino acid transport system substrate-binding protein
MLAVTGRLLMAKPNRLRPVASTLITAVWLTACSAAPQPAAPSGAAGAPQGAQINSTPIKIGYMADANGTSAPIAAGMHLGTDLAVQQINGAGGINGHPIQVTYVDPQSDPTQASQMATQLIQTDKVDVLMGAVLSSECLVVQQLVLKLQVVYLPTFGCAAEEFSTQFCNRYSFRFEPVGRQQLGPLVEYIVKTYGKNWAMMYSDYAYGQSQLRAYTDELGKLGASISLPIRTQSSAVRHQYPCRRLHQRGHHQRAGRRRPDARVAGVGTVWHCAEGPGHRQLGP